MFSPGRMPGSLGTEFVLVLASGMARQVARGSTLRVAFFVQGEGRGHMTQSLAMKRMLEDAGHSVVAVFMGDNPERPIPPFVREKLGSILHTYRAPSFVLDKRQKGVRPWSSLLQASKQLPHYWSVGPEIHRKVREARPNLIVNFLDLLGGIYTSLYRPGIPVVAVAHQFLFFHPQFPTFRGRWWEVLGVKLYTLLTALTADLRLALSFTTLPDLPRWKIRVVPPLLRDTVLAAEAREGKHILAYVLYPGYAEELDRWHRDHPEVDLHCFWDRRDVPATHSPRPGLTFHRLDDQVFVDLLATSRGFTSTAGFESVCEAGFLGKPIMVVPTRNHTEQLCNALDAERAGIARWKEEFDLTEFVAGIDAFDPDAREGFKAWVRGAQEVILPMLEVVAGGGDPMRRPSGRGPTPA
jgi:uncharacterized protein (TIGR00661 family)